MKNNISTDALQIFCQAAQHQSFSQAARMLGVSPAYITKQIKSLESQLETVLFYRTTREVNLTEQGEEVYLLAIEILQKIGSLHDRINQFKTELKGPLRVSTSMGFGRQIVAPALMEFGLLHPKIKIQIEVLDQLVNLTREQYHLDIRIGDLIDPNYIAKQLARNHRILCAAPAYIEQHGFPKHIDDLLQHNCLIIKERDHPVGIWELSKNGIARNIKIKGSLVTNNGEIALAWALKGRGIVLRSLWNTKKYIESGHLIHVLPEYTQAANIWAVYPQRLDNSAKIKACIEYLIAYFKKSNTIN